MISRRALLGSAGCLLAAPIVMRAAPVRTLPALSAECFLDAVITLPGAPSIIKTAGSAVLLSLCTPVDIAILA